MRRWGSVQQEGDAHALRASDLSQRCRRPGFAFHHLGEESQPHRDDLVVLGKLGDRLIQEGLLVLGEIVRFFGQCPIGLPECRQHFPRMAWIKKIDESDVLIRDEIDFQVPHEPTGGEPEIIPHQHNGLDMLAIAVPKSGDQLRVLAAALRMEPLLELVEDEQHFALRWQDATPPQACQRINQPRSSGQFRTNLS